ncbi:hypothetical protein FACS1894200_01950 [Spirochaetia bacterium]|nr:hypothetical protein FACS1894200_01950 [Spirochaetia bacterium]
MLDYRFIVENIDAVKKNIADRFMKADADETVRLFKHRTELSTALQLCGLSLPSQESAGHLCASRAIPINGTLYSTLWRAYAEHSVAIR